MLYMTPGDRIEYFHYYAQPGSHPFRVLIGTIRDSGVTNQDNFSTGDWIVEVEVPNLKGSKVLSTTQRMNGTYILLDCEYEIFIPNDKERNGYILPEYPTVDYL